MNTDQIMDAMFAPPTPANEVVPLDRATVEAILTELEAKDPNRGIVVGLRLKLSAPKVELWAMHSPGPGLLHPMLSREEAEAQAKATADRCAEIGQEQGWNLDPVTINVVPSPWEPTEHFQLAATERQEETDRMRELAIGRGEELAATKVALDAAEQRNAALVKAMERIRFRCESFSDEAKGMQKDSVRTMLDIATKALNPSESGAVV